MYRNCVSRNSHKDLLMLFAFEKFLSPCWLNVHSAWNGNTAGFQNSLRPNQELIQFILASGLPSSSLSTIELLRSWLMTRFSRQLYTLASDKMNPRNGNFSICALRRGAKNKDVQRIATQQITTCTSRRPVGGFCSLPHLASLFKNKASCATCGRESKRKQCVPCPTYSHQRWQQVDSSAVQWAKDGTMNSSRINVCTCTSSM